MSGNYALNGKVYDSTGNEIGWREEDGTDRLYVTTDASGNQTAGGVPVGLTPPEVLGVRTMIYGQGGINPAIVSLRKKAVRHCVWWGDSTIEAAATSIPFVYGTDYSCDNLPGVTYNINFGANGYSTTAILSAAQGSVNSGGNVITPEGVGAACCTADVLFITFGINDFRVDPGLATYGSSDWQASVIGLQTRLAEMVRRARVLAPNVPVVFLVQHPLTLTNPTFILSGVSGQIITDSLRAAALGVEYYSIPRLDSVVPNSAVCDSGGAVFGEVSFATGAYPDHMADDFHPNPHGYRMRTTYVMEWLAWIYEQGEYTTVARGRVADSGTAVFGVTFTGRHSTLFGNTSGVSYGAAKAPALGVGDIMSVDGSASAPWRRLRLSKPPYQNAAETQLRWGNGQGPDGAWHATDKTLSILRRRFSSEPELIASKTAGAYKVYPIRFTAGAIGSCTIVGAPGGTYSLSSYTPVATDFISAAALGGSDYVSETLGKSLTAATISVGSNPGTFTISLPGVNFTYCTSQLGAIISPV